MPITDYNKKKPLEVSSTNDSGTTQDKAQPIILSSSTIDTFENGESQLDWETSSGYSINTNSEITDSNSLQLSSSNETLQDNRNFNSEINQDGDSFETKIKIDSQTGNSNDSVRVLFRHENSSIAEVSFTGDGNVDVQGETDSNDVDTWNAGQIYNLEIVFNFTNNEFDVILDSTTIASNQAFGNKFIGSVNADSTDEIELINDTSFSSSSVNTFFDNQTFTGGSGESKTGTGDIVIDFTNIADEQDIAVYDQDGNLLDYEIESLDTSAETGVIWAYDSWVRDDTVQAQVAYGDNSANTDRQNVTATWSNTGQNAVMVQHLNGNFIDSTSNNNDGTGNGGVSFDSSGEFAGNYLFDETDDFISFPFSDWNQDFTVVAWAKNNDYTDSSSNFIVGFTDDNGDVMHIRPGKNDSTITFAGRSGKGIIEASTTALENNKHQMHMATYDDSGADYRYYIDGNEEANSLGDSSFGSFASASSAVGAALDQNGNDATFPGAEVWDGELDEIRIYTGVKTSEFTQAEHDASPRGGQVFFSQQAAEATVTDQTVTVPETQTSLLNPDPQVNATVDVSIPTSTAALVNPAPTVSPGTAPLNVTASTASTANPDFTVQPGETTVQTPVSTATVSNPDPQVNAFNEITVPETNVATINPAPSLTVGQTILTPETTVTSTNPDLTVQPGETSLKISTTQVSTSNPEFGLNRQIVVGVATNLSSENPEPNMQAGTVSVQVPETSILTENPALQLQPGATRLQIERPTNLETVNPDFNTVSGAAELQVSETQLTASVQEPSIGLTLEFVSPTNALITNDERFFDMPDHTFTEGDLGDTLTATLKDDASPEGVDLTGATEIRLVVKDRDGVKVFDKEMSIVDSSNGDVEYKWSQGDFIEEPGVYRSKIKVFDSSDEPESFPNDGFRTIEIEEEIG